MLGSNSMRALLAMMCVSILGLTAVDAHARRGSSSGYKTIGPTSSAKVVSRSRGASPGTGSKSSSTRVKGHVTKKGQYVPSHQRSTPDRNLRNNWSTKGNTNPYTGKAGARDLPSGQ